MTERWLHELRKLRQIEPPEGLWEQAASLTANQAARPLSPPSTQSRRIWSAIAAAIAVALIAAAVIAIRSDSGTEQQPSAWPGGVYTDSRFGWTIRIPAGWHVHHITGAFRWSLDGVRIASFTPNLSHRTGGEPEMGWLRRFPASGVAAQIWYLGSPGPAPTRSASFPLRISTFHRVRPYVGGAEPAPHYRSFAADGYGFTAAVWAGPDASQAGKRAIWNVIRSLRFPRLRQGTIFNNSVYVLGPATNYPNGSVTIFPATSLPLIRYPRFTRGFYLVHGSRGLYVVDRMFISPNRPPKVTCTVAFDRVASRFYCPGSKLRWNLTGRELVPHPGPRYGWDLSPRTAVVSTDGHVLVSPTFGGFGS